MATSYILWCINVTILYCIVVLVAPCKAAMEGFIVGGDYANILDFPHAVCLHMYCGKRGRPPYVCGGSVLNQRLVITAAHCVDECTNRHEIRVIAGSSNVKEAQVERKVAGMKIHDRYDEDTMIHDIALLYISVDLRFGRNIKRVIIRKSFPLRTEATIAGWGVISEQQDPTVRLKFVTQYVWPAKWCNEQSKLLPGAFCASSGSDQDYPYVGDSGSGLIITKKAQLIGMVSYRYDDKPELTYYTNVSYYYLWIQRHTKELHCQSEK